MSERLRQLELVGCGAMAEVYRGALMGEHGTSRQVAIKRLRPDLRGDPAAVDLFVNEARIAVRLAHPNVVHALELTRDDAGYALICEWLECASLEELLEMGRKLPPFAVIHVGRCLCNALDYVHQLNNEDGSPLGLVHRDVTPANVFLTESGQVKLADFGVAWCAGDRSRVEAIAGTPEYAAPEQQAGNDIDGRADIYGLGATLRAVAEKLPEDLALVLDRACAETPDARFASAGELASAFEGVSDRVGSTTAGHKLADLMESCRGEPRAPAPKLDGAVQSILGNALDEDRPRTTGRDEPHVEEKRPLPIRALVGLLIIVALAAVYVWRENTQPPPPPTPIRVATAPLPRPEPPPTPEPTREPAPVREPEVRPERPTKKAVVKARGTVNLNAVPWAKVKIDGRDVGNTPVKALSLSEGRHLVVLFNPAQMLRREVAIDVDGNRVQTFLVNLRRGSVQKRLID